MKVIFKIVVFTFLLFSQLCFPQRDYSAFEKEIIAKSKKYMDEPNFSKAHFFFLQKEWDSSLV